MRARDRGEWRMRARDRVETVCGAAVKWDQ